MMRLSICLAVLLCCLGALPANARTLYLAGPYAPFCVNKGLHTNGIAIDTFTTVMKMVDETFDTSQVKFVEWDMAYKVAEAKPDCVLLGIPRTPEVENDFQWVGPIDFPREVLIGKAGKNYNIETIADASKYKVAAVRGSSTVTYLLDHGLDRKAFKISTTYVQPLLQLKTGQVDLIGFRDMEAAYLMRRMHLHVKDYQLVYRSKGIPLYFAFSKDTPPEKVKLYNNALASYKQVAPGGDSAYKKMVRKYLPKGVVK